MIKIYIDSIYKININKIELYAIINEEYEIGISLNYILMKKKLEENSNIFSNEIISCYIRFFDYIWNLDINSMMIYIDKYILKLNIIKIYILNNYLIIESMRI